MTHALIYCYITTLLTLWVLEHASALTGSSSGSILDTFQQYGSTERVTSCKIEVSVLSCDVLHIS